MKKLLQIILLLLFCSNAFSQDKIKTEMNTEVDKMIEDLDKSKITSGILLERSGNFAMLSEFNSRLKDKHINYSYFKQALLDIHMASNKKKFISSSNLKSEIENNKTAHDIVDVGIISVDYQSLNYVANDEKLGGLKLKNNKYVHRKNKEAFLNHSNVIISPLKLACKGSVITYKFNKRYWFNDSKKIIKNLTIDFVNNEKHQIIKNGEITKNSVKISYSSSGVKELNYKVTFSDGTSDILKGSIYVIAMNTNSRAPNTNNGKIENGSTTADISFQGYHDSDETNAIYGQIDYRIYFRLNEGSNPSLKKPIIIIDGFDPGDRRRIEDTDCASDPDCIKYYIDCPFFINDCSGIIPFDSNDHTSILEFNRYNASGDNVIEDLRNNGYDVIIVNHPTYQSGGRTIDGGADFIERNALTLTKLIRDVNERVENNGFQKELVIVGPSMGGQISRYALAYMEKKLSEDTNPNSGPDWNHYTRLWISVDSPHLGANISIGIQSFLHQAMLKGQDAAEDFVKQQLRSPAAKQQLIEQIYEPDFFEGIHPLIQNQLTPNYLNARTVSQGYSFSRGAPSYQVFYNNLFNNGLPSSKGYPQNLRKLSLVNGSMSGLRDYLSDLPQIPNDKYVSNGEKSLELKAFNGVGLHTASIETYFIPSIGTNSKISRFKKAFSDKSKYMTNYNSRGNMDNVPGGWFPGQYEIKKSTLEAGLPFGAGSWQVRKLKDAHSFIASFSAIGHLSPDRSWHQALNKNLVCQNLTPFDSYFGHDKNTRHTSFNDTSVAWLLAEIGTIIDSPTPQLPYFPVNPNNLVGASTICTNNVKTYTFIACSTPGDVSSWSVSDNLTIVPGTDGPNSITITSLTSTTAPGYIEASFANGVVVRKDIWVGRPRVPASLSGPTVVNTGALVNYNSGIAQGATSYRWRLPYPFQVSNPIDYFANDWQMAPTNHRYLTAMTGYGQNAGLVQVSGKNICGEGGAKILNVSHNGTNDGGNDDDGDTGGGGLPDNPKDGGGIPRWADQGLSTDIYNTIKVYPNPANDIVNISVSQTESNKYIKILLFDNLGRLISDINSEGESLSINTFKLSNGIYVLKVFSDNYRTTKKIIVQH